MKHFSLNSRSSFLFSYKNGNILKNGSFILLQSSKCYICMCLYVYYIICTLCTYIYIYTHIIYIYIYIYIYIFCIQYFLKKKLVIVCICCISIFVSCLTCSSTKLFWLGTMKYIVVSINFEIHWEKFCFFNT